MDKETIEYIQEMESNWKTLREYLIEYRDKYSSPITNNRPGVNVDVGRYCVAMSIDDILKKMDEIERR